jgi:hypothetical protein
MNRELRRTITIGLGGFTGGFTASQGFARGMNVLGTLGLILLVLVMAYIWQGRWRRR